MSGEGRAIELPEWRWGSFAKQGLGPPRRRPPAFPLTHTSAMPRVQERRGGSCALSQDLRCFQAGERASTRFELAATLRLSGTVWFTSLCSSQSHAASTLHQLAPLLRRRSWLATAAHLSWRASKLARPLPVSWGPVLLPSLPPRTLAANCAPCEHRYAAMLRPARCAVVLRLQNHNGSRDICCTHALLLEHGAKLGHRPLPGPGVRLRLAHLLTCR